MEEEERECDRVVTERESEQGTLYVCVLSVCQNCVCVCARVPRRRQTLAALSELTGPSPLPLLVAQGGRERQSRARNGKDTVAPMKCLYNSKQMCPPSVHMQT